MKKTTKEKDHDKNEKCQSLKQKQTLSTNIPAMKIQMMLKTVRRRLNVPSTAVSVGM